MKALFFGLLIAVGTVGSANAQSNDALCYHAGLTYSPGSMIRMGPSLQQCAVTDGGMSVWTPVTPTDDGSVSANCLSGGREFGQGSILPAGGIDLKCSKGIWYPLKD